jgi:exosortase E/protease (VPEID-CTERM system)
MSTSTAVESGKSNRVRTSSRVRLWAAISLVLGEIIAVSFAFNFPTGLPEAINPVAWAKCSAQAGLLAFVTLTLVLWPDRGKVIDAWSRATRDSNWVVHALANIALFALLLPATIAFSDFAAHAAERPWVWFALYCCLLLATLLSLANIAAPFPFWRWLVREAPSQIATAIVSAAALVLAGRLSLEGWDALSSATLRVSHWILTLYESNVVLDLDRELLGVGEFKVRVLRECSGYEGIGLIVCFLALYCVLMRRKLRFPHALALFPLAIAAVWTLNAARIAALVSIGHHVSPVLALNGFHSQAGWIAFLTVAFGVIALSQKVAFFNREPHVAPIARATSRPRDQLVFALLVPFAALMAATIVASAFAPHDQWLYPLKVAAVSAALWHYRKSYVGLLAGVSPVSIGIGLAVGVLWIATDVHEPTDKVGTWLATLPAWLAVLWLGARAFGSVLLVPIAEELAFRGYLQRTLINRDISHVAPGQFTWLSFVVVSVVFGLMHQRWLAAMLAGAIYALLLYRSNKMADPIAAHIASNSVIIAWAIAAQQWSLL